MTNSAFNSHSTSTLKCLSFFALALAGGGGLLASPLTRAEGEAVNLTTNTTDKFSVTVDVSCMLSAEVSAEHTATIYPGQTEENIGTILPFVLIQKGIVHRN